MCKHKNEELLPYYQKAKEKYFYNKDNGKFYRKESYGKRLKGSEVGYKCAYDYLEVRISIKGQEKGIRLHRLAWFITYGYIPEIIDHIDCCRINNKIINLRECTIQQNTMNMRLKKSNKTGVKGVYLWKGKFRAQLGFNNKRISLGIYTTIDEAESVLKKARLKYHGEFARDK